MVEVQARHGAAARGDSQPGRSRAGAAAGQFDERDADVAGLGGGVYLDGVGDRGKPGRRGDHFRTGVDTEPDRVESGISVGVQNGLAERAGTAVGRRGDGVDAWHTAAFQLSNVQAEPPTGRASPLMPAAIPRIRHAPPPFNRPVTHRSVRGLLTSPEIVHKPKPHANAVISHVVSR